MAILPPLKIQIEYLSLVPNSSFSTFTCSVVIIFVTGSSDPDVANPAGAERQASRSSLHPLGKTVIAEGALLSYVQLRVKVATP